MPSIPDIATGAAEAATSLKVLFEAVKAALGLAKNTDLNAAIIDIQEKLIEHEKAYTELVEKHHAVTMERNALKQELLEIKQLQANFKRYELKALAPGFSAYVLKQSAANGEPAHWLCPHCKAKGVIGFLQLSPNDTFQAQFFPGEQNLAHLVCGNCRMEFTMPRSAFTATWGKYA